MEKKSPSRNIYLQYTYSSVNSLKSDESISCAHIIRCVFVCDKKGINLLGWMTKENQYENFPDSIFKPYSKIYMYHAIWIFVWCEYARHTLDARHHDWKWCCCFCVKCKRTSGVLFKNSRSWKWLPFVNIL